MKKVTLLTMVLVGLYAGLFAQDKTDFGLAKTGLRIEGIYIFIDSKPYNDYDYAGDLKLKDPYTNKKSFEKLLKKTKKKYPAANGLIISSENPKKAEIITFRAAVKSGGGFRVGDKVRAFYAGGNFIEGTVIQIDNKKGKLRVSYLKDEKQTSDWYVFKKVAKSE